MNFAAAAAAALLLAAADGGGGESKNKLMGNVEGDSVDRMPPPSASPLSSSAGVLLEGSPTSYAQFRPWRGGANATLEVEFSTPQPDALLLYADSRRTGEYVQLSLVGGAVRLRYNWGQGRAGMLTAGRDLNYSEEVGDETDKDGRRKRRWHHVALVNGGGETALVVDGVFRQSTAFGKRGQKGGKKMGGGGFFESAGGNQVSLILSSLWICHLNDSCVKHFASFLRSRTCTWEAFPPGTLSGVTSWPCPWCCWSLGCGARSACFGTGPRPRAPPRAARSGAGRSRGSQGRQRLCRR